MTRQQAYVTASFFALFLVLMFGFNTKPKTLLKQERSRMLNLQATDISILRNEAFNSLSSPDKSRLQILESQLEATTDSTERQQKLRNLSSTWFELGIYSMAGHYAEELAKELGTADAWGIAGTTYALGASRTEIEKERLYNRDKAIECLEMAISEDPQNMDYKINRAVVYAEHPYQENPMRGIQLLLDLNKNFPENVSVMNNLARFALRTNQLDRALERLTQALTLEPYNRQTNCLLAELYERKNDPAEAKKFRNICDN